MSKKQRHEHPETYPRSKSIKSTVVRIVFVPQNTPLSSYPLFVDMADISMPKPAMV
jgi:hypothetical protein